MMSSKRECIVMNKFDKQEGRKLMGIWKAWVIMGGKAIDTWGVLVGLKVG